MAGLVNVPKLVDFRNKVKRSGHFPKLNLKDKTTLAIHHSLTKQGLGGSNAEGYARFHVDTHGWPSIGYSYVIELDGTIKFCNDIEYRTYHVGDHNDYAIGVCLTGDFRYEEPTDEQKESLRHLVFALQEEYPHIKHVKGHNEFSGYEWKPCPAFDYQSILEQGKPQSSKDIGKTHVIQEADTFWSLAKGQPFSVTDLEKANPSVNPKQLKIGQTINIPNEESNKADKENINYEGNSIVDYLNLLGIDASKENRFRLAKQYDVSNYDLSAEKNLELLNAMRGTSKKEKQKKTYIKLPASADKWLVYKLNRPAVAANSNNHAGRLKPSKFGGLTYEVLDWEIDNIVAIIKTQDFGKVKIFVNPGRTDARIISK